MSNSLLFRTTAAAALATVTATAAFAAPLVVSTDADAGEGSLRQAIEAAAAMGKEATIVVTTDSDIQINAPLIYAGTHGLTLIGNGNTIAAQDDFTVLTASNGASLTISSLTFAGPGGFDIENRADGDGVTGKGIFIDVADDATGTVELNLTNVTVQGVANHGIHVSDCNLADDCGSGGGGAGEGSDASISVALHNVAIIDAGNGKFDADGLRVDERGAGDISLTAINSIFQGVGADGIELDEGQAGDVTATVIGSLFELNGIYCHPAILDAYLPEEDEGVFDEKAATEADIPGPVTGSPDDGCFEREVSLYDSGYVEEYEFGIDVDDGFDIDEAGEGSLYVTMSGSVITGNLDEGADFDEEGEGGITAWFFNTLAEGNTDDGYKNSEEDGGDVIGGLIGSAAVNNGGKGAVFEQEDGGNLDLSIISALASGNDDSDETGVEAVQDGEGTARLIVKDSDIADGFDLDGVDVSNM